VANPSNLRVESDKNPEGVAAASEPEADRAIVAVIGNRIYISRDNGVIELELHGMRLPQATAIASEQGADPTSTEVALPLEAHLRTATTEWQDPVFPKVAAQVQALPAAAEQAGVGPGTEHRPAVIAPTEPPTIAGAWESGVFRLQVTGISGQRVRVQRAFSLDGFWEDWQMLRTSEVPTELTDEAAGGRDQMFYRAVTE
jgi:hypothetical protein